MLSSQKFHIWYLQIIETFTTDFKIYWHYTFLTNVDWHLMLNCCNIQHSWTDIHCTLPIISITSYGTLLIPTVHPYWHLLYPTVTLCTHPQISTVAYCYTLHTPTDTYSTPLILTVHPHWHPLYSTDTHRTLLLTYFVKNEICDISNYSVSIFSIFVMRLGVQIPTTTDLNLEDIEGGDSF